MCESIIMIVNNNREFSEVPLRGLNSRKNNDELTTQETIHAAAVPCRFNGVIGSSRVVC